MREMIELIQTVSIFPPKIQLAKYYVNSLFCLFCYCTVYCSETMLTGESLFHISTPLGIEPRSHMTECKLVEHWTSGTVYDCS